MNRQMLEKSGINYDEGVKRFSGNVALYEKFLVKFLTDETFNNCKKAIYSEDYIAAADYIHSLKGVAGNLSMNLLYRKCAVLIDNLREDKLSEMDEQFAELNSIYTQTIEALLSE